MTWNLLQISDVLDLEFGSALAESVSLTAWEPRRTLSPLRALLSHQESERSHPDPPLQVRSLPLLRGFARTPLRQLVPSAAAITRRLLRQTSSPETSPLLCTVPYFAPVAERWPGPVVYWLTDLIAEYAGANRRRIEALDTRLCRRATLICPNSSRLAGYLRQSAACPPDKIHVLPNATRQANLLPAAPIAPAPLPADVQDLPRPIAGIIGNLAGNMDWELLAPLIEQTPGISWLFVGPTSMAIKDPKQRASREKVMAHPRTRFIGARPYGQLASFARAFDVAVLPYRRHEPTYSGSSTRFYEHLAACRPMIATRGFEELLHKEPLLTLIDTAEEAANALRSLEASDFIDGHAHARWLASQQGSWQARARTLIRELEQRLALARDTPSDSGEIRSFPSTLAATSEQHSALS